MKFNHDGTTCRRDPAISATEAPESSPPGEVVRRLPSNACLVPFFFRDAFQKVSLDNCCASGRWPAKGGRFPIPNPPHFRANPVSLQAVTGPLGRLHIVQGYSPQSCAEALCWAGLRLAPSRYRNSARRAFFAACRMGVGVSGSWMRRARSWFIWRKSLGVIIEFPLSIADGWCRWPALRRPRDVRLPEMIAVVECSRTIALSSLCSPVSTHIERPFA
jgi:hypothetical protein